MNVEVAVIGAGTAGTAAFRQVMKRSGRAVLIEGGAFGTTCARVGCMPSKALLASAKRCHAVRGADRFGISPGALAVDGVAVMERIRRLRDRFVDHVRQEIANWPADRVLASQARFLDDHRLALDDGRVISADSIVIATGSSPSIPDPIRAVGRALHTTDTLFDWPDLPPSVVVVGSGAVGVEISQALAMLGVKTVLLGQNGEVAGLSDPDLLPLARSLVGEGLRYIGEQEILEVTAADGGVRFALDTPSGHAVVEGALVVAAAGRTPNVERLRLASTTMELEDNGVPKFNPLTGRTSVDHILMAGDVNGHRPVLHEAAFEGKRAGAGALFPDIVGTSPRPVPLRMVFSEPGIAMVGATHRQLSENGTGFITGRADFSDQGRARVDGRNCGAARIYAEPVSGRLLGAELIAPDAEHAAHLLAWAIQARIHVPELVDYPYYHPTTTEGLRTALRDINRQLGFEPDIPDRSIDCGPGA